MTTYSKGEWIYGENTKCIRNDSTSTILANVCSPKGYDANDKERDANGMLIAASPQMLNALEYIYAILRDSQMADKVQAAGMNMSILVDAITKATGEAPY